MGHVPRGGLPLVILPAQRLVDRLFQLYERGGIFSARNARIIHHSGELRVPWPWLTPWRFPYASSLRRYVEWDVDYVERALFFVDVTIIIVGQAMRLGPSVAMPIIVNLDVVLAQRKRRLTNLADAVGITIQNLSILKTGRALSIRFTTLEAICAELDCQPGDILEYQPPVPGRDQPADSTEAPVGMAQGDTEADDS